MAKEYKIDEDAVSVTAVVCFLIITTFGTDAKAGEYIRTYYLGAAGKTLISSGAWKGIFKISSK